MKVWLSKHAKLKRWIAIIIFGIICFCYSICKIIVLKQIGYKDIFEVISTFTIGLVLIINGIIHFSKRTIELAIESMDSRMVNKKNVNLNKIIFNKNIYEQGPHIVVIGGGSGINSVLEGLKKYTSNITAIIDTSDYGVNPSYSRQVLKTLPLSDVKDSMVALSSNQEEMFKILNYKFGKNSRFAGLEFSDILFATARANSKNYIEAVKKCSQVLNITGTVMPITMEPMNVIAELENGMQVDQKDQLEKIVYEKFTKIDRVFLKPGNIKPSQGVIDQIKKADAIIIGPGALYTNVIPCLLVNGVAKAIKESKGLKIYVSNIMTTPGQTDNYSLKDHIDAIIEHCGNIIDYCIYDSGDIAPEFIKKYNRYGQELIDQDKGRNKNIEFIQKDLACVKNGYIRHNSKAIAHSIIELICDDLRYKDKMQDPQYLMMENLLNTEKEIKIKKKNANKRKNKNQANLRKSKWDQKYKSRMMSIREVDLGLKNNDKKSQNDNEDSGISNGINIEKNLYKNKKKQYHKSA